FHVVSPRWGSGGDRLELRSRRCSGAPGDARESLQTAEDLCWHAWCCPLRINPVRFDCVGKTLRNTAAEVAAAALFPDPQRHASARGSTAGLRRRLASVPGAKSFASPPTFSHFKEHRHEPTCRFHAAIPGTDQEARRARRAV